MTALKCAIDGHLDFTCSENAIYILKTIQNILTMNKTQNVTRQTHDVESMLVYQQHWLNELCLLGSSYTNTTRETNITHCIKFKIADLYNMVIVIFPELWRDEGYEISSDWQRSAEAESGDAVWDSAASNSRDAEGARSGEENTTVQRQTAVISYLKSQRLLPFAFSLQTTFITLPVT